MGTVVWFTGLSGAGKSTIADGMRLHLESGGRLVRMIDGDDVRRTLNRHLGFSQADILENNAIVARLCEAARREADVVLVPIISPYRAGRSAARHVLGDGFLEVYVKASLECVRQRDVKGLYARADRGEIENMVGLSPSAPYEPPERPDLVIDTEAEAATVSIQRLADFLETRLVTAAIGRLVAP